MLAESEGLIKESLGMPPSALLMLDSGAAQGRALLANVPPLLLEAMEVRPKLCRLKSILEFGAQAMHNRHAPGQCAALVA